MLDPQLLAVDRLRVCAVLQEVNAVEGEYQMHLKALGDAVGLAGPELEAATLPLEEAGYLCRQRYVVGRRKRGSTREWLNLTQSGVEAFERQLADLEDLQATATTTTATKHD
ncbi:hypothetical protein [Actinomyces trachealis]|uniref:hypothetical protein n=1 Tax=Actinomyces trachealis TaxID=2763540 RepID=UPI001892A744|nr:hypothetical protein [Actinomyces trachealis]